MNTIEGETYQDRVISQSILWLNCKPIHNHVDGECCIDFSCCEPDLFTKDLDERKKLYMNILLKAIPRCTNWLKYVIVPVV